MYIASFRNERCRLIHSGIVGLGDERNVSTMVDHRELAQDVLRQLVDRAMKSQPTRRVRQRCEECPYCVQIRRKNRANRNVSRVVALYARAYFSTILNPWSCRIDAPRQLARKHVIP